MDTYRVYDTAWMRGQGDITYTGDALRVAMMITATKSQAQKHPELKDIMLKKSRDRAVSANNR